jgi:hypothetical protein
MEFLAMRYADRSLLTGTTTVLLAAGLLMAQATGHGAFAQTTPSGPVASSCTAEISKYCADQQHGAGAVRACLEANRQDLSAPCREALDSTGGGRGRRR